MYRGDFLSGFHLPRVASEFEDWIVTERERLQRRAFHVLLLLVEAAEKSGNDEAAVTWLRRAADMRPGDETICRRLIEALAAAGDRPAALAVYRRMARCLSDEYGVTPTAETKSLVDAIRRSSETHQSPGNAQRRVTDPRVVEAFLKGRYFTSTIEHTARGLQCLRRALDLDPAFAPAHAASALSLANLAIMGHLHPADARSQAGGAARLALHSDATLGEAHTAIGVISMIFDWDWKAAERELRMGIALGPNSSDAHSYFAQFLCAVGRPDEGIAEAAFAQRLDPLGPWANFTLGWALFRARRHERSIQQLRALLELYPHFAYAHLFLAENHLSMAAYSEAIAACRTALDLLPEDQLLLGLTACVTGLSGEQDLARSISARLETLARTRYVCPGHLAAAHLGVKDPDRAFECWAAMCRSRSALACLVPTDPLYDCVRDDVRFAEVFDQMRRGELSFR
jgi:tetratricopeptide (TPR) repeat protein